MEMEEKVSSFTCVCLYYYYTTGWGASPYPLMVAPHGLLIATPFTSSELFLDVGGVILFFFFS